MSKVAEALVFMFFSSSDIISFFSLIFRFSCINYFEQYVEYDGFLTAPEWPNPWTSDTTELWEQDKQRFAIRLTHIYIVFLSMHKILLILIIQQRGTIKTCEKMGIWSSRIATGSRWTRTFHKILRQRIFRREFEVYIFVCLIKYSTRN